MTHEIFVWLLIISILLMQAVRFVLIARLRTGYPRIYQELGRPASLGRMHTFVFALSRRDDFATMSPADKSIVQASRVLFVLPFVFAFGALVTLTVS